MSVPQELSEEVANSMMRKVIARRLTESKATVPHLYSTIACEIDELLAFRKQLKEEQGVKVSVNDLVIKATALAVRDVPTVNRSWNAERGVAESNSAVDISVAVATPTGLITPILTNAADRGIVEISEAVRELAGRARDGKLTPEEYNGGSATISNLGMFGIDVFSAVINYPPQAAILAVAAGAPTVVPPREAGGKPRVATMLKVQLSSDRRVMDEQVAGEFLQTFQQYISNPKLMLL